MAVSGGPNQKILNGGVLIIQSSSYGFYNNRECGKTAMVLLRSLIDDDIKGYSVIG